MTFRNILVASDGSDLANRAVQQAGEIAGKLGARLSVVTVSAPPPSFAPSEIGWSVPATVYDELKAANAASAKQIFAKAASASPAPITDTIHAESPSPAEGILQAANELGADLIVMGSHGHKGINRLLLGSQATKVLSLATMPVLIVK